MGCIHTNITVHARLGYDPTHTTVLRNQFAAEMRKRFRALRGLIRKAIIDQDVLGLKSENPLVSADMDLPGRKAFNFPRSRDKIDSFMNWIRAQESKGILEKGGLATVRLPAAGEAIEEAWTDLYIKDSYKRGVHRARYELDKAGFDVPDIEETGGIQGSMSTPFHVDRVGALYTRTFNGLKGITDAMDHQISQVLAEGIAEGDNPNLLAKKLTRTISGPIGDLGIRDTLNRFIPAERRAVMLARTEIIRAHHQAMIQEYQNWGAEGVVVKAEWATAGDNRVCPDCAILEGQVYSLDEIRGMIPLHPMCRCVALPKKKKKRKTTRKKAAPKPAAVLFNPMIFPDERGMITYYNNSFDEIFKDIYDPIDKNVYGITKKEFESLQNYTGQSFITENNHLRGFQKVPLDTDYGKFVASEIRSIKRLYKKQPALKDDLLLYRGGSDPELFEKVINGENVVGREMTDKGFMSLSLDQKVANEFLLKEISNRKPMRLVVRAKKGSKNFIHAANTFEREFVGKPSTKFKIVKQEIKEMTEDEVGRVVATTPNIPEKFVELTIEEK